MVENRMKISPLTIRIEAYFCADLTYYVNEKQLRKKKNNNNNNKKHGKSWKGRSSPSDSQISIVTTPKFWHTDCRIQSTVPTIVVRFVHAYTVLKKKNATCL